MTFLPIVERELRVRARQRSAYSLRFAAAVAAFGLFAFISLASRSATIAETAQAIFLAISIVCLVFAMLAGVFLTSDCLSEERREGTLGLLFLTDLKGHDVVLGKLVSTSLVAVFCLLAVLPILALPLMVGGMSPGEFWRTALALVVTIFFSLSTAMLVSALSKDSRTAMFGSLLVMILLAGLMPVLWWMQELTARLHALDFLLWASPAYTFRRALAAYYVVRAGPGEFWNSVATLFGLGVVSLVTASVVLPRVWQEAPSATATQRRAQGRSELRYGSPADQWERRALLSAQPFYWLATRDRLPKLWAQYSLGGLLMVWLVFYIGIFNAGRGKAGDFFGIALLMSYGMHLIYKCLVATEASRRLSEDRLSGALELLLATPLSPREIIGAQQEAVWDAFAGPRRLLVGMNLLLIFLLGAANPMNMQGDDLLTFMLILIGGVLLLYLDTYALTRAGMWSALAATRHTRAVLSTLRQVMLLPWLAILLMFFFASLSGAMRKGTPETLMFFWFLFGILVDVAVGVKAEGRLRENFRAAAAGTHERPVIAVDGLPSLAGEPVEA